MGLLAISLLLATALVVANAQATLLARTSADAAVVAELLARAAGFAEQVPDEVEASLGESMVGQATVVAQLVAAAEAAGDSPEAIVARLRAIVATSEIDEIWVTDSRGHGYLNTPGIEFTFDPDPARQPQASAFWPLLSGEATRVVQESRRRETDDRWFKYVGVGGVDRPRIVQVGVEASLVQRLRERTGLARLVDSLVANPEIDAIRVVDPALRTMVARSDARIGAWHPERNELAERQLRETLEQGAIEVAEHDGRILATAPIVDGAGRRLGAVQVWRSLAAAHAALRQQVLAAVAVGVVALVVGAVVALLLARSIGRPVAAAVGVAERIAAGSLGGETQVSRIVEIGRLLAALGTMRGSLRTLIGRMQRAGGRLASAERVTLEALEHQAGTVQEFGTSTARISTAVAEISATSRGLLEATAAVSEVADRAGVAADGGRVGLAEMADAMRRLDGAMEALGDRLGLVNERAEAITAVVSTIARVADRTNLLSVNAAIEAERAGEAGAGFRVVAREIRRLADSTALSTVDIERLVGQMQSAVAEGTMEMDRFRAEVKERLGQVDEIGRRIAEVIEPVRDLAARLERVEEGMQAQSIGAAQIGEAMTALEEGSGATVRSIDAFRAALSQMREAIEELNAEAGRFRLE